MALNSDQQNELTVRFAAYAARMSAGRPNGGTLPCRAVLGYHVSLNREYSRYDVIRTIENALAPHRPRQVTLPGIGYGASGGFPSGKLSELGYATW